MWEILIFRKVFEANLSVCIFWLSFKGVARGIILIWICWLLTKFEICIFVQVVSPYQADHVSIVSSIIQWSCHRLLHQYYYHFLSTGYQDFIFNLIICLGFSVTQWLVFSFSCWTLHWKWAGVDRRFQKVCCHLLKTIQLTDWELFILMTFLFIFQSDDFLSGPIHFYSLNSQ